MKLKVATPIATAALTLALAAPANAGQELADLTKAGPDRRGPTDILLATGENPITAEEFETYEPPPGYLKNTERTAQFQDQETLSSPGEPEPNVTDVTTSDGYTWIIVARTRSSMWPFDASQYPALEPPPETGWEAAFVTPTPPEGVIRYSDNSKNQLMHFWARENGDTGAPILRYFVRDRWGNRYMMMATNATTVEETTAAFERAVLPRGWKKSTGFLKESVTLTPAYDLDDRAHFNVWRDSGDNSWVQIGWGRKGKSVARKIGDTMPIWGGRRGDRLLGTNGDDRFHGAEGNDKFIPHRGDDVVFGDAGKANRVVLRGRAASWRVVASGEDTVTLARRGDRKRLDHIQRIRFGDRSCRAVAVRNGGGDAAKPRCP